MKTLNECFGGNVEKEGERGSDRQESRGEKREWGDFLKIDEDIGGEGKEKGK